MASASLSSTIIASYSDSLLVAPKPKRITCSTLSLVGEVNCKPMSAPICLEARSTQSVHRPVLFGKASGCGISEGSQPGISPSSKVSTCTRCHTRSIPLPNGTSFLTYQVCELSPGVADQLAPQRGEPGSMGGAFGWLSEGLKQLVRGSYIWSPHRLRTF